jgi:hypothetical protein
MPNPPLKPAIARCHLPRRTVPANRASNSIESDPFDYVAELGDFRANFEKNFENYNNIDELRSICPAAPHSA